ncbi:hypothetical protein [Methanimicrococcus blatticola]|uniref:hypothetical protein n=1 Tax=Methanimicrococcus blatticola TaxID=91560 RepID=UPI00105E77A2|nr:hypothetical protein [Methanimicrococcus blatticola]MBZ3935444.1 hypothetical protein [Methanimicrococcus blatticola]
MFAFAALCLLLPRCVCFCRVASAFAALCLLLPRCVCFCCVASAFVALCLLCCVASALFYRIRSLTRTWVLLPCRLHLQPTAADAARPRETRHLKIEMKNDKRF